MEVTKRDGAIVPYDRNKIENAIRKAMIDCGETDLRKLDEVTAAIDMILHDSQAAWSVDSISDLVESELIVHNYIEVAKSYMAWRAMRNIERPVDVAYKHLSKEFLSKYKHIEPPMSDLGVLVYYRTYSRFIPNKNRREYWWETVARAVDYNCGLAPTPIAEAETLYDNIFHLRQFLSGRTFWVGGTPVAEHYPMANYNCSAEIIQDFSDFKDLFYLLMIGSGVGLRMLDSDIANLPKIRTNVRLVQEEGNPVDPTKRIDHTEISFDGNEIANIIVGDSKEGWVQALDFYLSLLWEREYRLIKTIIINYDLVRPKGEKLKTFGGTASGHASIMTMFKKIHNIICDRGDKRSNGYAKLQPIDCLDMSNIIGENVVVGGVRRTSQIILFDPDNKDMVDAKSTIYEEVDAWGDRWKLDESKTHRHMSNNSIYYKDKPTRNQLHWQIEKMRYSGEPAFVNQKAIAKRRGGEALVNPSMPRDVKVQTTDGIFNINELEGKAFQVKVLNGDIADAECWLSSPSSLVYDIEFETNTHTFATAKHKYPVLTTNGIRRIEVKDLEIGDCIPLNRAELQGFSGELTFSDGLFAGYMIASGSISKDRDGTLSGRILFSDNSPISKQFILEHYLQYSGESMTFSAESQERIKRTYVSFSNQNFIEEYLIGKLGLSIETHATKLPKPIWKQGDKFARGVLTALFTYKSKIIYETAVAPRMTISSTYSKLMDDIQVLLGFYGIKTKLSTRDKVRKLQSTDITYRQHMLTINTVSTRVLANLIELLDTTKQFGLDMARSTSLEIGKENQHQVIKSITLRGVEAVWDIRVDHDQHVFPSQHCYTGNCGEILLDNKGLCNLTTVNVSAFVTNQKLDDVKLLQAQALSARAGYRMTTIELELPKWDATQRKDRLLGCSLTGWQDMVNSAKLDKRQEASLLAKLRDVAHVQSGYYAQELGLPAPLLVTTVKPEGSLSQLPTVSSGIHHSHSPYYIRRVRINASDPLAKVCEELEYPMFPEVGQTMANCTTKVIEFPVKAPEGKTKYDVSALEQLENYKLFMRNYVDHNASITVHVLPDEWDIVEQWVWDNWEEVVAISFLPLTDSFYKLMPYEKISKEEYWVRKQNMRSFLPELLSKYELVEQDLDVGDVECVGGACPIR